LVFVTGEEKADWFNRTDNRASFPRYELVDEYRRHSGGGALSLISLHEFLELMKLPAEVLSEVRSAEKDARRAEQERHRVFLYSVPHFGSSDRQSGGATVYSTPNSAIVVTPVSTVTHVSTLTSVSSGAVGFQRAGNSILFKGITQGSDDETDSPPKQSNFFPSISVGFFARPASTHLYRHGR
jgi:hypothetical protein